MKKLMAILVSALIILSVAALTVSAYGRGQNADCRGNGANYVDSDNDGICDNRPESGRGQNADCKGNGANYVDSDNDGICDNRPACGRGQGKCRNR